MYEVVLVDSKVKTEIGTFGWDVVPALGDVVDDMKIVEVVEEPECGSDYEVHIVYV